MNLIQYHLNFRPSNEWILKESQLPYLELNLTIPIDQILNEWQQVESLAVSHRSTESLSNKFFYGHKGWKSLVLYGKDSNATSDNTRPFVWTSIAEQCPMTVKWLSDLFEIDENTGRIRFMQLEPGGHILPHNDRTIKGLNEINIAITHPDNCIFRFLNYGDIPFSPGKAFILDTSNDHMVVNNSSASRLHIIVHSKLKNQDIIKKSYATRYNN
jgi:hypothetical protein